METELLAAAQAAALVGLAEIGDKSQLVCLMLGARHGAWRVIAGAALAFSLLNALAVLAGGALEATLSPRLIAGASAALFALFGALALCSGEEPAPSAPQVSARGGIAASFGLLFVAELGDKTQLMVAALAADASPAGTWLGGTLALVGLAGLGALAGRSTKALGSTQILRRLGGLTFLAIAAYAALRAAGLT